MAKKIYKIPVSWEVCGEIIIKADNLQEAINYCYSSAFEVCNQESFYIDGSFKVDNEDGQILEETYPKEKFSFKTVFHNKVK